MILFKISERSIPAIVTCLQPEGKTILKSHGSHSKPVAFCCFTVDLPRKSNIEPSEGEWNWIADSWNRTSTSFNYRCYSHRLLSMFLIIAVTITGHSHWILAIAWCPDGTKLASACKKGQVSTDIHYRCLISQYSCVCWSYYSCNQSRRSQCDWMTYIIVLVWFQESAIRFDSPSEGSIFDSWARSTVEPWIKL